MADSTVRYQDINEEYPIAGQDNDSQGFRDNFSEIKTALENANLELTSLLTNTAKLNDENDFNKNTVSNAAFLQTTNTVYNTGNINADSRIEWNDGSVQNVNVVSDVTLTLAAWSDNGRYGKMRLIIRSDGATRTINWEADNAGAIRVSPNWPAGDFTVSSATTPVIVDAWTTDGGITVFMEYQGTFNILS